RYVFYQFLDENIKNGILRQRRLSSFEPIARRRPVINEQAFLVPYGTSLVRFEVDGVSIYLDKRSLAEKKGAVAWQANGDDESVTITTDADRYAISYFRRDGSVVDNLSYLEVFDKEKVVAIIVGDRIPRKMFENLSEDLQARGIQEFTVGYLGPQVDVGNQIMLGHLCRVPEELVGHQIFYSFMMTDQGYREFKVETVDQVMKEEVSYPIYHIFNRDGSQFRFSRAQVNKTTRDVVVVAIKQAPRAVIEYGKVVRGRGVVQFEDTNFGLLVSLPQKYLGRRIRVELIHGVIVLMGILPDIVHPTGEIIPFARIVKEGRLIGSSWTGNLSVKELAALGQITITHVSRDAHVSGTGKSLSVAPTTELGSTGLGHQINIDQGVIQSMVDPEGNLLESAAKEASVTLRNPEQEEATIKSLLEGRFPVILTVNVVGHRMISAVVGIGATIEERTFAESHMSAEELSDPRRMIARMAERIDEILVMMQDREVSIQGVAIGVDASLVGSKKRRIVATDAIVWKRTDIEALIRETLCSRGSMRSRRTFPIIVRNNQEVLGEVLGAYLGITHAHEREDGHRVVALNLEGDSWVYEGGEFRALRDDLWGGGKEGLFERPLSKQGMELLVEALISISSTTKIKTIYLLNQPFAQSPRRQVLLQLHKQLRRRGFAHLDVRVFSDIPQTRLRLLGTANQVAVREPIHRRPYFREQVVEFEGDQIDHGLVEGIPVYVDKQSIVKKLKFPVMLRRLKISVTDQGLYRMAGEASALEWRELPYLQIWSRQELVALVVGDRISEKLFGLLAANLHARGIEEFHVGYLGPLTGTEGEIRMGPYKLQLGSKFTGHVAYYTFRWFHTEFLPYRVQVADRILPDQNCYFLVHLYPEGQRPTSHFVGHGQRHVVRESIRQSQRAVVENAWLMFYQRLAIFRWNAHSADEEILLTLPKQLARRYADVEMEHGIPVRVTAHPTVWDPQEHHVDLIQVRDDQGRIVESFYHEITFEALKRKGVVVVGPVDQWAVTPERLTASREEGAGRQDRYLYFVNGTLSEVRDQGGNIVPLSELSAEQTGDLAENKRELRLFLRDEGPAPSPFLIKVVEGWIQYLIPGYPRLYLSREQRKEGNTYVRSFALRGWKVLR
ncbi:MAG: hypothetical protein NUV91_05860, partial [Candidatus Omnitrophica bacterium]|nr:hypothetical protein [Candidatus Omnitrophota bacterium]